MAQCPCPPIFIALFFRSQSRFTHCIWLLCLFVSWYRTVLYLFNDIRLLRNLRQFPYRMSHILDLWFFPQGHSTSSSMPLFPVNWNLSQNAWLYLSQGFWASFLHRWYCYFLQHQINRRIKSGCSTTVVLILIIGLSLWLMNFFIVWLSCPL
jgi:hypothetical protein